MIGRTAKSLDRHLKSEDRKSTRLNSSHQIISYAVFCLKKKNTLFQDFTFSKELSHDETDPYQPPIRHDIQSPPRLELVKITTTLLQDAPVHNDVRAPSA